MMCNYIPAVAGLGASVPRLGRGHAQIVPYQAFACSDGEYLMVGAFTRVFWVNLCKALDREAWTIDPRFSANSARLHHRDLLIGELEAIFRTRPRAHWLDLLLEADVPCSPVLELHDAVRSEQVAHGDAIETIEGNGRSARVVRSPIRVAQWDAAARALSPDLGADSRAVLADLLDLDDEAIAHLVETNVVAQSEEPA